MTIIRIIGPMFSGKTSRLFEIGHKYSHGKRGVFIKKNTDNRYGSGSFIKTHSGTKKDAIVLSDISELREVVDDYDVFAIDEGQFWNGIVDLVREFSTMGKIVIIACLSGDYRRKPWSTLDGLEAICDETISMTSTCYKCGCTAPFTKLVTDKFGDTGDELIISAGDDVFKPTCLKHWM